MDANAINLQVTNVLATDLDGTLIPVEGCEQNQADLLVLAQKLADAQVPLIFVTGRHLGSIQRAIETFRLPLPNWIVGDVGTSIYERDLGGEWTLIESYASHLQASVGDMSLEVVRYAFEHFDDLTLQAPEKQGRFKLSYYCPRESVKSVAERLQLRLDELGAPYGVTNSLDPFTTHGLIDILPRVASKAAALQWWAKHYRIDTEKIVFAGDSGNDLAPMTVGLRSIVVGNADPELTRAVRAVHSSAGWKDRLFVAEANATSGVLEGCQWFGVL